ncbi:MAG: TIGR04283 family arsenosugar biosynthesis glycosyltransferase [Pyrinomonadaceae bacterium]
MGSSQKNQTPTVSIIIPALNEAHSIGATLKAVVRLSPGTEVVVVDGGSVDQTCEIAKACGAHVIASERGRGVQMHRGAAVAKGDVFWFLHADTIVPTESFDLIAEALRDERVVAGNFNIHFDAPGAAARFMTWLYPQLRRLGLCYGDSAIFVRREAYERSGGFNPLPIFEDLELLRRLKRMGRFVHLSSTVITSGRRFAGSRFIGTFIRWIALQLLYWLGVSPGRLGGWYAPVRQSGKELNMVLVRNKSNRADI